MPGLDALAATIQDVATPGAKPREIITAVRLRHPGASKKDVVRAAFYALTAGMDADPDKARRLHDLAIEGRGHAPVEPGEPTRPGKRRSKAGKAGRT